MGSQLDLSRRQPLLPLGLGLRRALLRRAEARPLQGRGAQRARADRRQVRLAEGAGHPRRARRRGGPRVRRRALRARPRDGRAGEGPADVLARVSRRHAGPRPRERRDLQHDQRLRHRGRRLAHGDPPAADQGRPLGHHAHDRLPGLHPVLVAQRGRRRQRRHAHAARAGRGLEQHGQAPPGDGAGRARGALRGRDGDGDRGRGGAAAPPPPDEQPHRHRPAARQRQGRHRGGARVRRGRHPRVLRHHADLRDDGAGHQGRRLRDGLRRAGQRDGLPAAGAPRRAGDPLPAAGARRPAHGRADDGAAQPPRPVPARRAGAPLRAAGDDRATPAPTTTCRAAGWPRRRRRTR